MRKVPLFCMKSFWIRGTKMHILLLTEVMNIWMKSLRNIAQIWCIRELSVIISTFLWQRLLLVPR